MSPYRRCSQRSVDIPGGGCLDGGVGGGVDGGAGGSVKVRVAPTLGGSTSPLGCDSPCGDLTALLDSIPLGGAPEGQAAETSKRKT